MSRAVLPLYNLAAPPPPAGVAGAPNGLGAAPAGGPKGDCCAAGAGALPKGVLVALDPKPPEVPLPNAGAGALLDGPPKGEGAGALDAAAPNGDGLGALLPNALLFAEVDPNGWVVCPPPPKGEGEGAGAAPPNGEGDGAAAPPKGDGAGALAGAAPNAGAEEVELPPKRDEPLLAPVGAVGGLEPPCISAGNGLGTLSGEGRVDSGEGKKELVLDMRYDEARKAQ